MVVLLKEILISLEQPCKLDANFKKLGVQFTGANTLQIAVALVA